MAPKFDELATCTGVKLLQCVALVCYIFVFELHEFQSLGGDNDSAVKKNFSSILWMTPLPSTTAA